MPDRYADVNALYERACRLLGDQVVAAVASFVTGYRSRTGTTPDYLVVLAGTCVCAALASTRPDVLRAWSYDRRAGVLHVAATRAKIIVVEMPGLADWQYRIVAAGDVELGNPGMTGCEVQPVVVRNVTAVNHTRL